jgi:NAD(P)H-quinone oxidoreductase subunit 5
MDFAYQYAWLIPLLPLAAALIIGTGLISFNKSTNNLRSLWSTLSVSATGGAMVMAFNLLWSQIQGHDTSL